VLPSRAARFVALGLLVLAVGAAGLVAGRYTAPGPAPTSSSVLRPLPNVVIAVRDLARLEGAEYDVERVIDLSDKQKPLFGLVEAHDAILLIAAGQVTAGVDLGELGDGDVEVDRAARSARLRLPKPKILSSRLDNERTYVYRRQTDLLARRKESLETEARQTAERSIVEAAREGGIEGRAKKSVARTVESLVRSLGFTRVEIEFRD
jgi:hypothetical protein